MGVFTWAAVIDTIAINVPLSWFPARRDEAFGSTDISIVWKLSISAENPIDVLRLGGPSK